MNSNEFHETINHYLQSIQNLKEYVESLENSTISNYCADNWKFDLETIHDTEKVPEFVSTLYYPFPVLYRKEKCPNCDRNELIKLNDSDFYNHYKLCDCFLTGVRYEVREIDVIRIVENDTAILYECYISGKRVFINPRFVFDVFEESQSALLPQSVYYTASDECQKYIDKMNGE